VIDARGLSMSYGLVRALDDATFEARKGEVLGLLGSNGAGKTTTMRILTTYLVPTAGSATVAGIDVVKQPLEARKRIGYLPESLPLYLAMEVSECLTFVGRARGLKGAQLKERVSWVVEKCGLDAMFHTPVLHLSKGYKQRTALAQALIHDPEVVILDEPTTGLDPHQIIEIRALIRDLAKTKCVILSTHILTEATALADRLIVMSGGRIVGQGVADDLRRQAGVPPQVRVAVAGAPAGLGEKLGAVEGVGEVTSADDVYTLTEKSPGLAQRVGALANREGWTLVELTRVEGNLEDVFKALTKPPTAAPAGEVAA
jgi:ABC-2 type transport system ATP-binding protein